jgi:Zn-dependent M28 family amino/carboxypeptidase
MITTVFGTVDSLIAIQKRIDSTRAPQSFEIDHAVMNLKVTLERTRVMVPNVAGWLPGTTADSEHVAIGAHFDHVGTKHATEAGQDTIYNGADDNASGTTGLLEVARAFTATNVRPRRGVLFLAFSGEEKGLFGSRAYVDHPLIGLEKCVAMVNMDMIGRNDPDSLELGGAGHSPELTALAVEMNKEAGFKIKETDEHTGRSDQASFSAKKIPVLFFFTGEHRDYHQVGDSADKINFDKLTRVATLCLRTAWEIAGSETKFSYRN